MVSLGSRHNFDVCWSSELTPAIKTVTAVFGTLAWKGLQHFQCMTGQNGRSRLVEKAKATYGAKWQLAEVSVGNGARLELTVHVNKIERRLVRATSRQEEDTQVRLSVDDEAWRCVRSMDSPPHPGCSGKRGATDTLSPSSAWCQP